MQKARQMQAIAWGLSTGVAGIAVVAWGQSYEWQLGKMSVYQIFPLFGLLAFSLMWSHYVVSAIRQYFKVESKVLSHYFEITSAVVLTAILLHPGLLIWQLWRDGLGLPPGSAKTYVGAAAYWAIWLGIIAWTAFISYEFRRIFGTKKWWPIVQHASDVGMVLIFVHALRLGGALNSDWYRNIWYVYGASFVVALIYGYIQRYRRPPHDTDLKPSPADLGGRKNSLPIRRKRKPAKKALGFSTTKIATKK